MAVTQNWDETVPAGTDSPRLGDDRIRDLKAAIRERANNGGHLWTDGATDTEDGRHVCGTEFDTGGPGTPLAGEFYFYENDQTTRMLTLSDSTAAAPNRLYAPGLAASFSDVTLTNELTLIENTTGAKLVMANYTSVFCNYRDLTASGALPTPYSTFYTISGGSSVAISLPLISSLAYDGQLFVFTSRTNPTGTNTHLIQRSGADQLFGPLVGGTGIAFTLAAGPSGANVYRGSIVLLAAPTGWYAVAGVAPV